MADKSIDQLIAAESILATDVFVLQQSGIAKKLTAQVLENWLLELAGGHGGIQSYELLSTVGLVKTYRFTLADQSYMDIQVEDGRGISNIVKASTSGLVDTYRITYTDGSTSLFSVTNGAKGDKGDNTYTWVKYASQQPTSSSSSFGDVPDDWIGIYTGPLASAPTDWQQYTWYKIKGEQGDTGDPATVTSSQVSYLASDSGTVIPSGSWSTTVPLVTPGRYLWTRTVLQFNSGSPITTYSVSRFGIDGTGAVSTVCGVAPDNNGNVPLTAVNINALSNQGGAMYGALNMNGQQIENLPAPVRTDHATNKGYVDDQNKTLGDNVKTWIKDAVPTPDSTGADNGKILTVVNGAAAWQAVEVWAGGSY